MLLIVLFDTREDCWRVKTKKDRKSQFLLSFNKINLLLFRTRVAVTAYKNPTAMPKEADVQNAKLFVGQ